MYSLLDILTRRNVDGVARAALSPGADQPSVVDQIVQALPFSKVQILDRDDETEATVYADDAGAVTLTQPLTSNADGRVEGYVVPGRYLARSPDGDFADRPFEVLGKWENFIGVATHAADAGYTRPLGFGRVIWVGSVEPMNALEGDIWVEIA